MKRVFGLFIIAVVAACGLNLQPVKALGLSPAVMELEAERGSSIASAITILNNKESEQTYYLGTLKFEPQGETGQPKFIPYEEDHSGLTEWISFDERTVSVPASGQGIVPFSISVPSDIPSGGYYAAVTVSPAPADVIPGGATVEAKSATLILLTVLGENEENVELMDFQLVDPPGLITGTHYAFRYRLQNQGNVHETPQGFITVSDLFGRVVATMDANGMGAHILPDSTRAYDVIFNDPEESDGSFFEEVAREMRPFSLGPHTATLALTYGDAGLAVRDTITFWVFPWHACLFLVLVLVLVLGLAKAFLAVRKRP